MKGVLKIFFSLMVVFPLVTRGQLLSHDSTVSRFKDGVGSKELQFYRRDLANRYFMSLDYSDSVLGDRRLRYGISAYRKSHLTLNRLSKFVTDYRRDSAGTTYYFPINTVHKDPYFIYFRCAADLVPWPLERGMAPGKDFVPLLTLHGNMYYEFLYRSRLDTPFAASNFQQHIEQVYADMVYKGKYPFRINLNARQSNSPFFKNYVNVNVQFNPFAYRQNIKEGVYKDIEKRMTSLYDKKEVESLLRSRMSEYDSLRRWTEHPGRMREIVEEKEGRLASYNQLQGGKKDLEDKIRKVYGDKGMEGQVLDSLLKLYERLADHKEKAHQRADSLEGSISAEHGSVKNTDRIKRIRQTIDSLAAIVSKESKRTDSLQRVITGMQAMQKDWKKKVVDSLEALVLKKDSLARSLMGDSTAVEKELVNKRAQLTGLGQQIEKMRRTADSTKSVLAGELGEVKNKLNNARSVGEINEVIKSKGAKALDKGSQAMLGVQQFGIGRSMVNYSELTVKNISITGANMEYQNNFYAALAVGKVDYQFRDFIINPLKKNQQNLLLGRYGWLPGKNKSVVLTAYSGSKQGFTSGTASTPLSEAAPMHIMGYGLEVGYRVSRNVDFVGEVVKSSVPYRGTGTRDAMNKAFAFSDHNNEAWSVKMNMVIPALQSTLKAFYKKVGVDFQSFSIFSTGTRQESWGIKWQQYLWRKQLSLTVQVKKNDFDNPLITRNYSSASTLKSLQGSFRKRKWPLITVGYMPVTQLTKTPDGRLSENIFYAFNTMVSHSYRTRRTMMNTAVFYNKFSSKSTDSGFIYFGAKSLRLSQDIVRGKISSNSSLDYYTQPSLSYYTFSQTLNVQVCPDFNVGAGIKRGLVQGGKKYWGGSLQAGFRIKKIGSIQMQYDKGFLPDYTRSGLISNDWGRLVWTRTF